MEVDMNLDSALTALANPTRRAIVERLATDELTVSDLVEPFDLSQPTISHHLKVLTHSGIVVHRREGVRRIYRVNGVALSSLDAWLNRLRINMEANYNRLDLILNDMKEAKP